MTLFTSFMSDAIEQARCAAACNEVPVGAVVLHDNKGIIARGHNMMETMQDATAHAEMIVLRKAASYLGSKYLDMCDLYVSLEPCPMCAQAISLSRVRRVYFAVQRDDFAHIGQIGGDMLRGGGGSGSGGTPMCCIGYMPEVYIGEMQEEAKSIMSNFFCSIRGKTL